MNFRLAPVGRSVVEKLLLGDVGGGKFRYGQRVKILLQNAPLDVFERAAWHIKHSFLAVFLADGALYSACSGGCCTGRASEFPRRLPAKRQAHPDRFSCGHILPFSNTKHSNDSELNRYSRSEF